MSTDTAIADAIKNLPEWWDIRIAISKEGTIIELFDDVGKFIKCGDARSGTIAERVNAALATAQDYVDDHG